MLSGQASQRRSVKHKCLNLDSLIEVNPHPLIVSMLGAAM